MKLYRTSVKGSEKRDRERGRHRERERERERERDIERKRDYVSTKMQMGMLGVNVYNKLYI